MVSHRNVIASLVQVAVSMAAEGPNPILEVCCPYFCESQSDGLPRTILNALEIRLCMRMPFGEVLRPFVYVSNVHSIMLAADHLLYVFPCR